VLVDKEVITRILFILQQKTERLTNCVWK